MTLRKYLAGLALLFAIPGVVLLVLGNGIAVMFFIIVGFFALGTMAAPSAYSDEDIRRTDEAALAELDEYHSNPAYLGSLARLDD